MAAPWWDRFPARLEMELKALDAAGIVYDKDEEAFRAGVLQLNIRYEIDGEALDLVAVYPDLFPYVRFQVMAPGLTLGRHQHPFGKHLCLIGRSTWNWHTTDTLASYLVQRLPLLLTTARTPDPILASSIEEPQGEPFTDYYPYLTGAMVFVDSSWQLDPTVASGRLVLALDIEMMAHEGQTIPLVRGAIAEIRTMDKNLLETADPALLTSFPGRLPTRWVRLAMPPVETDSSKLLELAGIKPGQLHWQRFQGKDMAIIGLVFPEEVQQGEFGDAWIFLVFIRGHGSYLTRAGRAGRGDLKARVPELAPLASKTIAVFGLGGIGSPSVVELAKAGAAEIRVLDHDFVDPATTVRWALGLPSAGHLKTEALFQHIRLHYPYTRIRVWPHRIGGTRDPQEPRQRSDLEVLAEMLEGADLIYDATAEIGIHHILSDAARERGLPYVYAHTTHGGWGGLVARIQPGRTEGCWLCLQYALADGTLPEPPSDPNGSVQPIGCADPTFTGTGFDIATVALESVRTITGVLCHDAEAGYPDVEWDVAVLSLRDAAGRRVPTAWRTFPLKRHPSCPQCR